MNNDINNIPSREAKNKELYKTIKKNEVQNFKINSNSTIIDENNEFIDIEELQRTLHKRYNAEEPKANTIKYNKEVKELKDEEHDREFDINILLEQAKDKKEVNYEVDRLKKIRTDQFEILNSLDIEEEEEILDDELASLIGTISSNEDIDPLGLLANLEGTQEQQIQEEDKPKFGLEDTVELLEINDEETTEEASTEEESFDEDLFEEESINNDQIKEEIIEELEDEVTEEPILVSEDTIAITDLDDTIINEEYQEFIEEKIIDNDDDFLEDEDFSDEKIDQIIEEAEQTVQEIENKFDADKGDDYSFKDIESKKTNKIIVLLEVILAIIILFGVFYLLNGIFEWI